jgi:hypothetical protein
MPCQNQASKAGHRRSLAQVICRPLPTSAPLAWYGEMDQGREPAGTLVQHRRHTTVIRSNQPYGRWSDFLSSILRQPLCDDLKYSSISTGLIRSTQTTWLHTPVPSLLA